MQVFIAVLAIDANGATVAYRKMWLGEEEAKRFTPGPEPAKLTVDGWRLGLAVCKDTGVARRPGGHRRAGYRRLPGRHGHGCRRG